MKSNYWIKHLGGTLIFFLFIFLGAGTFHYWQGLAYVGLGLLMFVLANTVFALDAELMAERAKPHEDSKAWDKKILGLSFLATLAMFVVAGLDSGRFHHNADAPLWIFATGFALTAAGQLLFLVAQKQNRFFSSTVRIQTDRNHQVCDTGLYRVVRHPGYMGSLVQTLGFPLFFCSWWSIVPVLFSVLLLLWRTAKEDAALLAELDGYKAYAASTRYKLIPGIW